MSTCVWKKVVVQFSPEEQKRYLYKYVYKWYRPIEVSEPKDYIHDLYNNHETRP